MQSESNKTTINAVDTTDPFAALDAVIYYYASMHWPSYTEYERKLKPEWTNDLSEAQSLALRRHQKRMKAANP